MKRGTRGKKAILVMLDTLRRDFLGCYGSEWVRTPRLDALARETAVFEDFRTASFPTVPAAATSRPGGSRSPGRAGSRSRTSTRSWRRRSTPAASSPR